MSVSNIDKVISIMNSTTVDLVDSIRLWNPSGYAVEANKAKLLLATLADSVRSAEDPISALAEKIRETYDYSDFPTDDKTRDISARAEAIQVVWTVFGISPVVKQSDDALAIDEVNAAVRLAERQLA